MLIALVQCSHGNHCISIYKILSHGLNMACLCYCAIEWSTGFQHPSVESCHIEWFVGCFCFMLCILQIIDLSTLNPDSNWFSNWCKFNVNLMHIVHVHNALGGTSSRVHVDFKCSHLHTVYHSALVRSVLQPAIISRWAATWNTVCSPERCSLSI